MASSMARLLVVVCVALLVANVDSARTLKQVTTAQTFPAEVFYASQDHATTLDAFPTEVSYASQDHATTLDAAPVSTPSEYDYNKSDVVPEEVFADQGTLYSEAPPVDGTPVGTTEDVFATDGIVVGGLPGNPGDSYASTTSEYPTDSYPQGSSDVVIPEGSYVTGDNQDLSLANNPDGSSINPEYVFNAVQDHSDFQFSDLDTSNYDSQPGVGAFTYEETVPGN